ncbi:MAG: metalloregulator ArsR/SmtB family transcription factor [Acidobacteriota bacterium]|nr:metalloregulator ArsR/SmtB family transcription factor [Acidobacteriota bacterium]
MRLARVFKALSDGSRLRALSALQNNELCVCQIVELLGLAPSTVSKHMSILADAGLVESSKKGRWVYYRQASGRTTQTTSLLALLPKLLEDEPQLENDHRVLAQILTLDPETLCRIQSERTGADADPDHRRLAGAAERT